MVKKVTQYLGKECINHNLAPHGLETLKKKFKRQFVPVEMNR